MDFELYGDPALGPDVLDAVIRILAKALHEVFRLRSYGPREIGISIVVAGPELYAKASHVVRFVKIGENRRHLQLLLSCQNLAVAEPCERLQLLAQQLRDQIPALIGRHPIPDFDHLHFIRDWQEAIDAMAAKGWQRF